ncbi:Uncharacterized protein dnm_012690 [Desulfonema magnum]|uniref:Uncharacterized protein n=1 Tax=Desulfonema magnum TaxID=45655 RepID=A0A975BGE8_9BACT|nr:Uncharacterized protein dnm_012690 [Desulfonema magnum]
MFSRGGEGPPSGEKSRIFTPHRPKFSDLMTQETASAEKSGAFPANFQTIKSVT